MVVPADQMVVPADRVVVPGDRVVAQMALQPLALLSLNQ
jgi:hypothetical protein